MRKLKKLLARDFIRTDDGNLRYTKLLENVISNYVGELLRDVDNELFEILSLQNVSRDNDVKRQGKEGTAKPLLPAGSMICDIRVEFERRTL